MLLGCSYEGPSAGRAPYWGEAGYGGRRSGFSYDTEVVSHGFFTDITKTDPENKERLHVLIDEA